MEARAELHQPRISKWLVVVVAMSVTLGLGVMAGTVAKNLNGSSATTSTQTHAIVQGKGGLAGQSIRRGGMQTVDENAAPTVIRGVSPDAQDRKAQQAAPKYFLPDGLGFRES